MISGNTKIQITELLQNKLAIGQSRHQAKKESNSLFEFNNESKIHSWNTYNTYKRECEHFASWVNETYNKSNFNAFKQYVPAYFEYLKEKGTPATSLNTKLAALRKVYNDSFSDIKLPPVRRQDITRGRYATRYSMSFSQEKNEELINFMSKTGLRRRELQSITGDSLKLIDNKYYIHIKNGKGGKVRDVLILDQDQRVINKIKNTPDSRLVWGHISKHCPVHNYRADYATALYESLARPINELKQDEIYYCRGDKAGCRYDKEAMRIVSNNLGHNRLNVISQHYLYVK